MYLYHATTRERLASIQEQGLLVSKADPDARVLAIWLHTSSHSAWAVLHTIRKHQAQLEEVVVLKVRISSGLVHFRKGLWYTRHDVPASCIGAVVPGSIFGGSAIRY